MTHFLEDDDHEPFCSDIREGSLTYPIYYYFSQCDEQEQKEFLKVFGKNKVVNYSQIRRKIVDKNTIQHCLKKINRLVAEAIDLLQRFNPCYEKELLVAWAKNHILKIV